MSGKPQVRSGLRSGVPEKTQVRSGLRSGRPRDLDLRPGPDRSIFGPASFLCGEMEEDQESPDRNDEDTKFVRGQGHAIPTKKCPQAASEVSIVQDRKKIFKNMVKGGMETQTSSVVDKYLRDTVCDAIWERNTVTFPNGKQFHSNHKWLAAPDPQAHEDSVRYLTYGCVFRLVDGTDKRYQTFQAAPSTYPTVWI